MQYLPYASILQISGNDLQRLVSECRNMYSKASCYNPNIPNDVYERDVLGGSEVHAHIESIFGDAHRLDSFPFCNFSDTSVISELIFGQLCYNSEDVPPEPNSQHLCVIPVLAIIIAIPIQLLNKDKLS